VIDKRPSSDKMREATFDYWKVEVGGGLKLPCKCNSCKGALFNPLITDWDAHHQILRGHGGEDRPPNLVR
jgi:hypothetical protein